MYRFSVPAHSVNREGSAEGLLLFPHLEFDVLTDAEISAGYASFLIQDYFFRTTGDYQPIIPVINSELFCNVDTHELRKEATFWPAFITGGYLNTSLQLDEPSHYSAILRERRTDPSFLSGFIDTYSLSCHVDQDIIEEMHLCIGAVTFQCGLVTIEATGERDVPQDVLRS